MSDGSRTIAHVFSTFGAGGPQIRAVQLMGSFGAGVVHVVMAMDGQTQAAEQLPPGIDVSFAAPPPGRGFFATVRAQRRWLAKLQPDLVLTYNWGAIESVVAARRLGLPLVHHEEGFGPEEVERRFRRRNWIRRLVLKSVPVIVPSRVLRGIARSEWRVSDERLHLLSNGVDLARFAPTPTPRSENAEFTIGTVGGLRGEKDHSTLLRAFAKVPGSARLRIVGDGSLGDELRAQAAQLGIADRTEFVGAVSDTAPEYAKFDVFALSSRTEQMPIALLEAMASGCAVVATDVGDVRQMLPTSQHPFIVQREDAQALAAALVTIAGSSSLRQRLGADNRRRAEERYEAEQCFDRFASVYSSVCAKASVRPGATSRSPR